MNNHPLDGQDIFLINPNLVSKGEKRPRVEAKSIFPTSRDEDEYRSSGFGQFDRNTSIYEAHVHQFFISRLSNISEAHQKGIFNTFITTLREKQAYTVGEAYKFCNYPSVFSHLERRGNQEFNTEMAKYIVALIKK